MVDTSTGVTGGRSSGTSCAAVRDCAPSSKEPPAVSMTVSQISVRRAFAASSRLSCGATTSPIPYQRTRTPVRSGRRCRSAIARTLAAMSTPGANRPVCGRETEPTVGSPLSMTTIFGFWPSRTSSAAAEIPASTSASGEAATEAARVVRILLAAAISSRLIAWEVLPWTFRSTRCTGASSPPVEWMVALPCPETAPAMSSSSPGEGLMASRTGWF